MILENFKNNFLSTLVSLRYLVAFIFISAGLFRLFNYELSIIEMQELLLPIWLTWFISALEILGGLALLKGGKVARLAVIVFVVFMIIALCWSFVISNGAILAKPAELFVFNLTPTDFFLHFVFLLILLNLIKKPI